jgi:hypothetical protein
MTAIEICLLFVLAALLIVGVAAATMVIYFGHKERTRNAEVEYIKDLYKLQKKWSSRGYLNYAEGINLIIRGVMHDPALVAETEYGRSIQKQLQEND